MFGGVALLVVLGVTLLAVGLTMSLAAGILETQAAGRQRISLWRDDRGYRRTPGNVVARFMAGGLIGTGAVLLVVVWGTGAIFFVGFVFIPQLVVLALHNRYVRTSQLAPVAPKAGSSYSATVVEPNT